MQRTVYPDGTKMCRTCGISKPLSDFYFRTDKSGSRPMSYCKPCSKARSTAAWRANRDAINDRRNVRRRANPAGRREESRLRRIKDPFEGVRYHSRRRARLYGVSFEEIDYRELVERSGMVCGICMDAIHDGDLSFDHIIPMSRGGGHLKVNLQTAHRICNLRKNSLLPEEYALKRTSMLLVQCPSCDHHFEIFQGLNKKGPQD